MSDIGDRLIDFEADHFQELAEKFVDKYIASDKTVRNLWEDFVEAEFNDSMCDVEPPDREEYEEHKHPDQDNHIGKRMDEV